MATESYILHAYKPVKDSELLGIAQVLKAEKIVKDEAKKVNEWQTKWPHIYHFVLDKNKNE